MLRGRPRLLAGWRAARELRRSMHVQRHDRWQLVVSLRGELCPQQTTRTGWFLAELVSTGPERAHIDLADTNLVVGIGEMFVPVSAAAQAHHTRVTVHRADPEQRAALRRYGLDHLLFYSDRAP